MSRKMKFRAWNKANKEMVYFDHKKVDQFVAGHFYALIHGQDDSGIVMQFTGMKDCNGKDIYEGDIIKSVDGNILPSAVKYDNDYAQFIACDVNFLDADFDWEIIGNVYENNGK